MSAAALEISVAHRPRIECKSLAPIWRVAKQLADEKVSGFEFLKLFVFFSAAKQKGDASYRVFKRAIDFNLKLRILDSCWRSAS